MARIIRISTTHRFDTDKQAKQTNTQNTKATLACVLIRFSIQLKWLRVAEVAGREREGERKGEREAERKREREKEAEGAGGRRGRERQVSTQLQASS